MPTMGKSTCPWLNVSASAWVLGDRFKSVPPATVSGGSSIALESSGATDFFTLVFLLAVIIASGYGLALSEYWPSTTKAAPTVRVSVWNLADVARNNCRVKTIC